MDSLDLDTRLALSKELRIAGQRIREVAYCLDVLWYAAEAKDSDLLNSVPTYMSQQCRVLLETYDQLATIFDVLSPNVALEKLYEAADSESELA